MLKASVWRWISGVVLGALAGSGVAGELTGEVQWAQRIELGTPQSGIVVEVPVAAGELVKKGQLLVQLESRGLQARVRRAEAELAKARMEREEGQRELERAQELYERTLLSNHDLEQAKIAFAAVNSRYQAANATQVEARLELEQSSVKAPFDGVVLQRNVEVGQTVVSALQSVPLITLAATHLMRVNVEATQPQLERLKVKQKVEVIASDKRFRGAINFIGLEPLAGSGEPRYPVYVEFATEGSTLRVGTGAKVITP
ncbi:MAG TPA: efflux RND transporter periplasmic adaptor subunit [Gammaproteobacteria bacterium]